MCPLLASRRFLLQQSEGAAATPQPASRSPPRQPCLLGHCDQAKPSHCSGPSTLLPRETQSRLCPSGHPVRSRALAPGPSVTRTTTLAEGRAGRPDGGTGRRGRERQAQGSSRGHGTRSLGRVAAEWGPAWAGGQRCPEQSGDFRGARLGWGPGCQAPGGGLPSGCPARRGTGVGGRGTHCWTGAGEPGAACPPRAGAETLGDLAGGPAGGDSCCR